MRNNGQTLAPVSKKVEQLSWLATLKKSVIQAVLGDSSGDPQSAAPMASPGPVMPQLERSAGSSLSKATQPMLSQESARFDEHWLSLIQSRARSEGRRTGASIGCGLGAIGLVPFGPIAMCVCAIAGVLIGFLLGFLYDMNKARKRESAAQRELGRMTYLVRFAAEQISRRLFTHASQVDNEYCLDLLETVVLEFKPFVEVAHLSPVVHKKLALFHSFLRRQAVLQCLWIYVNGFLSKWASSLTAAEFVQTCLDILIPLVETERKLGLSEPQDRLEVIIRVEEFLSQPLIKQFLELHSRQSFTATGTANMESVLARDLRHHLSPDGLNVNRKTSSVYFAALQGSPLSGDAFQDVFHDTHEFETPTGPASPVRRSRAFFRSFKDFMDFDLELKHRMPVTEAEAQFLYEKEAEPLDGPGWELTVNRADIKVLRFLGSESVSATSSGSPPVLVRAYATLRNVSMENVFYHIVDPSVRPTWDTNFSSFSLLPAQEGEVLYCTLNAPFGVTPRDFLQYRRCIVEEHAVTIIMRSAVHAKKPLASGYIRAETYISGYVLHRAGADTELFLMTQTDIKGLIPKWIVNTMAAKAPAQWIDNLAKSCTKLCARKFNSDSNAMAEFLDQFKAQYKAERPDPASAAV